MTNYCNSCQIDHESQWHHGHGTADEQAHGTGPGRHEPNPCTDPAHSRHSRRTYARYGMSTARLL